MINVLEPSQASGESRSEEELDVITRFIPTTFNLVN